MPPHCARQKGVSFIGYNHTGNDPDSPGSSLDQQGFLKWAGRIFGQQNKDALAALYPVGHRTPHDSP